MLVGFAQMDEVDDDQPADAAQANLTADLVGGFEIDLDAGLLQPGRRGEAARVHVDRGQRLGAFDRDPAAGRQRHARAGQPVDLLLQIVEVEQRAGAGEQLDLALRLPAWRGGNRRARPRPRRRRRSPRATCRRAPCRASCARPDRDRDRASRARRALWRLASTGPPGFGEALGVFLQIGQRRVARGGAQDVARAGHEPVAAFARSSARPAPACARARRRPRCAATARRRACWARAPRAGREW